MAGREEDVTAAAGAAAVEAFNVRPAAGVAQAVRDGVLEASATAIARFLFATPQLSPARVGEYLGDNSETALQVLDEFCALFDFRWVDFDIALRRLLAKFRLPGEAQKCASPLSSSASSFSSPA
jgi:Sec7-like guanine-nucleotide exchange factor